MIPPPRATHCDPRLPLPSADGRGTIPGRLNEPNPGGTPMARSEAATVEESLAELPEARRAVVSAVREVLRRNLPEGYVESMSWGMISYEVPLSRYPDTYNKRPLSYVALAAQKSHLALYLP